MLLSLNCVQVGGGPTGVELAAEIHDMIAEDMSSYFPNLKVRPAALAPASVAHLQEQADGTCLSPQKSCSWCLLLMMWCCLPRGRGCFPSMYRNMQQLSYRVVCPPEARGTARAASCLRKASTHQCC